MTSTVAKDVPMFLNWVAKKDQIAVSTEPVVA
jgi:hypothetical protein